MYRHPVSFSPFLPRIQFSCCSYCVEVFLLVLTCFQPDVHEEMDDVRVIVIGTQNSKVYQKRPIQYADSYNLANFDTFHLARFFTLRLARIPPVHDRRELICSHKRAAHGFISFACSFIPKKCSSCFAALFPSFTQYNLHKDCQIDRVRLHFKM